MEKVLRTEYTGLPIYANCARMDVFSAEEIKRRLVNLPSSPDLVRA